jgi:hypothetical protein
MIRRDVIVVVRGSDPDHPRKRFPWPERAPGPAVQLDDRRGIRMSAFAEWGEELAVGSEFLAWVALDLLGVRVSGDRARRHRLQLDGTHRVSCERNMKRKTTRWTRRVTGPPRRST